MLTGRNRLSHTSLFHSRMPLKSDSLKCEKYKINKPNLTEIVFPLSHPHFHIRSLRMKNVERVSKKYAHTNRKSLQVKSKKGSWVISFINLHFVHISINLVVSGPPGDLTIVSLPGPSLQFDKIFLQHNHSVLYRNWKF